MSIRSINLDSSVYELCTQYPELPGILKSLGFTDIVKPGMLQTAGRIMTLPKGAKLKKIPLEKIISELAKQGFTVTGFD